MKQARRRGADLDIKQVWPISRTMSDQKPHAGAAPGKVLSQAARRALEEAEARRSAAEPSPDRVELGGPAGPEPTRYGDWERKGLASDF